MKLLAYAVSILLIGIVATVAAVFLWRLVRGRIDPKVLWYLFQGGVVLAAAIIYQATGPHPTVQLTPVLFFAGLIAFALTDIPLRIIDRLRERRHKAAERVADHPRRFDLPITAPRIGEVVGAKRDAFPRKPRSRFGQGSTA